MRNAEQGHVMTLNLYTVAKIKWGEPLTPQAGGGLNWQSALKKAAALADQAGAGGGTPGPSEE